MRPVCRNKKKCNRFGNHHLYWIYPIINIICFIFVTVLKKYAKCFRIILRVNFSHVLNVMIVLQYQVESIKTWINCNLIYIFHLPGQYHKQRNFQQNLGITLRYWYIINVSLTLIYMVAFIADDAFIPSFFAVQNLCYIVNQQANLNIIWGRIEANAVMNKLPSIYWNDLINPVNAEYYIINAIYILHHPNTAIAHAFEIIWHANQFKYFLYIQMWLWLTMWCKDPGLWQPLY